MFKRLILAVKENLNLNLNLSTNEWKFQFFQNVVWDRPIIIDEPNSDKIRPMDLIPSIDEFSNLKNSHHKGNKYYLYNKYENIVIEEEKESFEEDYHVIIREFMRFFPLLEKK